MQSSSSSFSYRFTYDVFLSFRGKDTRYGFTGHLYSALRDRGIHTFIDDKELRRGDKITSALEKAIQESRIFVIILSQNYASSAFCLNELAYILKFIKGKGLLVLPIFYSVDPSDARHHRGSFGEALANHENKFNAKEKGFKHKMKKLEEWKMALHQAADLSGYHFNHGDGYEYEFIKEIVELVSTKINRAPFHVADYPVGLESQVLKVKLLLDAGSDDVVHMVGIHGLGGVGKTTLAVAVCNCIADHFGALCFLENVRETSNKHGLQHLQSYLLSETVGEKEIKLTSVKQGISIIQHRLRQKKVLLILDDVDKLEQLQAIVGRPDWFGPGSRVIITTRDKQLLACHGIKRTYEVKELNKEHALQLLCWKAFKLEKVDPCYKDVLNRAVTYASGLPLALEVIGSNLFETSIKQWKSALDRYERIPNKRIHEILKVSYDALEEDEQSVFLDIACCFKEYELAEVEDILNAHHGHCMKHHIGVLVDKSLIKISFDGKVTLHDLIEDMGKEIVRTESPKEPGKRSRLWFPKDIFQVLEENKGTSKIEIIFMDFSLFEEEVEWDGYAFKKMKNLRTLVIRSGRFSKGPKHLPNTLRVFEWWRYPAQILPYDFHPKKLAIFKLPKSCFTSIELAALLLKKMFVNLTNLNFDKCQCLTQIPDVSCVPQLEKLSFQLCQNLSTIHYSVGFLEKLKILNALGCFNLKSFPPIKLSSLEQLELSFCISLKGFPEILGKMENITRLRSTVFSNVQHLRLRNCNLSDEFFPTVLPWLANNVKELDLSSNNFTVIPECIKECRFLTRLYLDNCERLREIRGIPPNLKHFSAIKCLSLTSSCRSMFLSQELHEAGNTVFYLPGAKIPEWFERQTWGPSISFWFRNKFPAIAICLVIGPVGQYSSPEDGYLFRAIVVINGNKQLFLFEDLWMGMDNTCLLDPQEMKLEDNFDEALTANEWSHAEIIYENLTSIPILIKSGIHVLKQESGMGDIQFTDPCRKRNLVDHLNSSESQNPQLLEKHRLVDMEVVETQFVQKQQHQGFIWRLWNWARSGVHFFLFQQSIVG